MKLEQYDLPVSWASFLVNGDSSGMYDYEFADASEWLEKHDNLSCLSVGDEQFYTSYHDVQDMIGAAMCAEYTFAVRGERGE